MNEYTVARLIAALQNDYDPTETVVISLWSKADVAQVIDDNGYGRDGLSDAEFVDNTWHHVSGDLSASLEYAEEKLNEEVIRFVESYVMRGEK